MGAQWGLVGRRGAWQGVVGRDELWDRASRRRAVVPAHAPPHSWGPVHTPPHHWPPSSTHMHTHRHTHTRRMADSHACPLLACVTHVIPAVQQLDRLTCRSPPCSHQYVAVRCTVLCCSAPFCIQCTCLHVQLNHGAARVLLRVLQGSSERAGGWTRLGSGSACSAILNSSTGVGTPGRNTALGANTRDLRNAAPVHVCDLLIDWTATGRHRHAHGWPPVRESMQRATQCSRKQQRRG